MVIQHMGHIEFYPAKFYFLAGFISLNLFIPDTVFAGEVRFTPSVMLKESYSDNILLAPKGQEQGDFVSEISPAFSLQTKSSHFTANVDYTLQNLLYLKDSNRNQSFNQLSANSKAELVDDYLFFDINANHRQRIVNADQPIANNNIAITSNRTNVSSYNLSPYFQHSFRGIMDAALRYSYSNVDYRRDELIDSKQTGIFFQLSSPARETGFNWGVNYSKRKNNFETGNDSTFSRGSLQLGYRLTTRTNVYATGGKENNSFIVNNNQNIDKSFWNVGADWQPGARDNITVEFGERFFGKTGRFGWQHNARRLVLNADYREELSTSALTLLGRQQVGSIDSRNQPVDTGNSITSQVYVRKIATLGLTYRLSKTSFALNYSNDRRIFQDTGDETRTEFVSASVQLRSSSVLTYVLGTRWNSRYTSSTGGKTFITNVNFAIQQQLTPRIQAELAVKHSFRNSTNALTDYDENILSVGITQTFN